MSKELVKAEQLPANLQLNSVDDIVRIGNVLFESKMFTDVGSVAQAVVKVLAGHELGIPPFQAMSGVHIIKGKPTIGAGLMASKVDSHPDYDYEVVQQNEKVCEIKFFKNGKARGTSKFTDADARRAGTQNMGKYPANMLFARAMSNGVKWYCPGIFSGPVYVPEEMQDISHEEVKPEVKQAHVSKQHPEPEERNDEAVVVEDHNRATEKQKELILKLSKSHVFDNDKVVERTLKTLDDMSKEKAIKAIEWLQQQIKERKEAEKQQAEPQEAQTVES